MPKWIGWSLWAWLATLLFFSGPALGQLKAVATLPDLGAILREVGGDRVKVNTVGRGDQDPHYVPAKPSLLRKFRGAQLLVFNGLELEVGWLPVLLQGARNPRLAPGSPGVFNASSAVRVLEVPKGEVSRAQGDIHPYGNPHIILDPRNGVRVAKALAQRLAEIDPAGAAAYRANAAGFADRLSKKIQDWGARMAPYRGRQVVTYHRIWSYFFDWAGLGYAGVIENKPGIPPAPVHVSQILKTMRSRNLKVIFLGNYLPRKIPQRLAGRAGARVVELPAQVGGAKGVKTYEDLIRTLVDRVTSALKD